MKSDLNRLKGSIMAKIKPCWKKYKHAAHYHGKDSDGHYKYRCLGVK